MVVDTTIPINLVKPPSHERIKLLNRFEEIEMPRTGTNINTIQKDISKGQHHQGTTPQKSKVVALVVESTSSRGKNTTLQKQFMKPKHG